MNIRYQECRTMRLLLALILIAYLVGVGVVLSPTIQTQWSGAPASELVASVAQELPRALAWPARSFQDISDRANGRG
jgi:hypothetical protein